MLETQQQWKLRICQEIWQEIRSRLYLSLRYLGGCLSALSPLEQPSFSGVGTDGIHLLFSCDHTIRLFSSNPTLLAREYLHLVLHGMLRHLFQTDGKEPRLWGLCCDIAVEKILDDLDIALLRRPLTWTRTKTYSLLKEHCSVLSSGAIYRFYIEYPLSPAQLEQLEQEFRTDDHSLWPWEQQNNPAIMQLSAEWSKRAKSVQTDLSSFSKKEAGDSSDLSQQLVDAYTPRRSYRDFLRRFCILREEIRPDPDSFDLAYYTFGLSHYGNLPLVEPTESKESFKVYELAIAIDTSMSCSGELVQQFLQETFSILKETDSFFHKVHLRILQADNQIQQDHKITCQEDLQEYLEHLTLKGGGGTDFRPVFTYLDYLCSRHAFHHLTGVLYFTDGKGTYPKQKPPWKTAFLFLDGQYDDSQLPPWAMKQVLYPEQWRAAAPSTSFHEHSSISDTL